MLSDTVGMKIAEALLICGPLGMYIIGLTDMDPLIRDLFIRYFKVLGQFKAAHIPENKLSAMQLELVVINCMFFYVLYCLFYVS